MLELNNITFKSFIVALSLLKSPLPKSKQARLNLIGREMALGLSGLSYLDKFAEDYSPLDEVYQPIRNLMTNPSLERNKWDFPKEDEYSEAGLTEIENIIKAMEDSGEDKIDEFFLVLQDIDSVKAAKKKIRSLAIVVFPSGDSEPIAQLSPMPRSLRRPLASHASLRARQGLAKTSSLEILQNLRGEERF